jgi:hypothetical protein
MGDEGWGCAERMDCPVWWGYSLPVYVGRKRPDLVYDRWGGW